MQVLFPTVHEAGARQLCACTPKIKKIKELFISFLTCFRFLRFYLSSSFYPVPAGAGNKDEFIAALRLISPSAPGFIPGQRGCDGAAASLQPRTLLREARILQNRKGFGKRKAAPAVCLIPGLFGFYITAGLQTIKRAFLLMFLKMKRQLSENVTNTNHCEFFCFNN